ncbi:MAG: ECF transporter S component [Vallitaleaceae bacterium]|jgi:uncharacterized membrane protein|nr:ECF transporter S component [Vallitaleaceae bacterium]
MKTTKELTAAGLLIAIAVILSYPMFKLMGSIGFDSMPAFLGAAVIGPIAGGFIGSIAHMVSALLTGMPLSLPIHLVVAVTMYMSCFAYGWTRKRSNRYLAIIVGIVMNGPISLGLSSLVAMAIGYPFAGMLMFATLIVPLTLAASVNVIIADVIVGFIGLRLSKSIGA